MKVPVTLLYFNEKAANEEENYVPLAPVEEYLSSSRWRYQKESRNILCSVTHFLRNEAGSEPGLGASDKLLKDGVVVGCLDDSWISKDRKSWEGIIEMFDDLSMYSESQKPFILQILRLIKNNVSIQISMCLGGDWSDEDGGLLYLDNAVGVDYTLNGAFFGSQIHPKLIKE